ncbi:MAG TPA: VOC family protein [Actinophytocola sp.]|jgi:predicted enzyme related to lactoylglutathione lyase|nr:VOC family protein [Actinophytocola sp.]
MIGYFTIDVPDPARAAAFYTAVFGWAYESTGDYHHVAGSSPAGGLTTGGPRTKPYFVVDDVAATAGRARELGGTATGPARSKSGWSAEVEDGHGTRLALWQPADGYRDDDPKGGEGDLFYFVQPVADDEARAYWATLLGWELTPGSHPNGWNIANVNPPGGVFVGAPGDTVLYFHVADVDATAERIRAAGGTAGPAQSNQAGAHADCRDDQAVAFGIGSLHEK